jgi:PAS domain S-box-containing protein
MPITVLLVEDSPADARVISEALKETGAGRFVLERAERLSGALEKLRTGRPDVVLLDLTLPDSQGLDTFRRVRSAAAALPVVVLTGLADEETGVQAVAAGAQDYLLKSELTGRLLVRALRYAIERRRAEDRVLELNEALERRVLERTAELQAANRELEQRQFQVRAALEGEHDARLAAEESERRFRNMTEAIPQIVWTATSARRLDYLSGRWSELTGLAPEAGLGEAWLAQAHREDVERIGKAWDAGAAGVQSFEAPCRLKAGNGSYRWQLMRGVPYAVKDGALQWYGTFTDIEDQKRAEELIFQKQKLEGIGLLAAGVAHDFNNLLTGIMGSASLLEEETGPGEHSEFVRAIVDGSRRAADLTRQLLAYAGKAQFTLASIDIEEEIRGVIQLLRASIAKTIEIEVEFEPGLPAIEADRVHVQQIVINLMQNAAEAIEGRDTGRIAIRLRRERLDEPFLAGQRAGVPAGEYVCLAVRDTGCGIAPDSLPHIFDPFYTTKFTGRGLGLAAVQGIVRTHKGLMRVESEPGRGAAFYVYLPAGRHPAASEPVEPAAARQTRGGKLILVVDDEEAVRQVAGLALEHHGFTALRAGTGREAIEIFSSMPDRIDVVLLDVTMPGMSGEETLREFLRIRPTVRVLLSSGYSETEIRRRFANAGAAGFLSKPYTVPELLNKLSEVCSRA